MNKKKVVCITVAIIIAVLFVWFVITDSINRSTAAKLAEIGEYQFLTNQLGEYLSNIGTSEVNDISCNAHLSYVFEEDYHADEKTLYVECTLDNFMSDQIEAYFTETYNDEPGCLLARIMGKIDANIVKKNYIYNVTDVGTVVICVSRATEGLVLTTSEGREYFYDYTPSRSIITVEINDRFVYFDSKPSDDNEELTYLTGIRECSLGHCDSPPREGSKYCLRHGCCVVGCQIEKDPFAHCCYKHNCSHPGCSAHVYEYANSKYCEMHHDEH